MIGAVTSLMGAVARPQRPKGYAVRRGPHQSRRARLVRAGAGMTTLIVLALVTWWVLTSPTFAVDHIKSGSYRFTSEDELQAAFSEFLGRNIWTLDTEEMSASLEQLPWIRDLHVVRRLPNSLEVDFREWSPLLMVETLDVAGQPRERLVLLSDGRLLDFPEHLVLPALPVLVGVRPVLEGQTGQLRLAAEESAQLLELISSMEDAGLESAYPVDFVVARSEGFAIVLQNEQGTLLVGRENFGPRLQRFMTARDHLATGLDYDLRFKNRITVREHN